MATMTDLNQVATFVRVVEAGSFTAAALVLGLPKSSVSRAVARLEDELGVRLLQRTTRSLHLTDTGRAFYERSRSALASLDEAAGHAADEGASPRGTVRLTAPIDIGIFDLAETLAEFLAAHPAIRVELSLTGRYVDLVAEGFDLAIRGGELEDSSLVARKVGEGDFGLFASPSYLARRGTPVTVAELATHDFVLQRGRAGVARMHLTDAEGNVHVVEPHGPVEVDELLFVRQAIEAGIGIGLLPVSVQPRCAKAGSVLVPVLPHHRRRGGAVYVVSPPIEQLPRRVLVLREFLIERLKRVVAGLGD